MPDNPKQCELSICVESGTRVFLGMRGRAWGRNIGNVATSCKPQASGC